MMMDVLLFVVNEKISFMYQRQQHSNVIAQKSVNSCTHNKKSEKKQKKKTREKGAKERHFWSSVFMYFLVVLSCV